MRDATLETDLFLTSLHPEENPQRAIWESFLLRNDLSLHESCTHKKVRLRSLPAPEPMFQSARALTCGGEARDQRRGRLPTERTTDAIPSLEEASRCLPGHHTAADKLVLHLLCSGGNLKPGCREVLQFDQPRMHALALTLYRHNHCKDQRHISKHLRRQSKLPHGHRRLTGACLQSSFYEGPCVSSCTRTSLLLITGRLSALGV